MKLWIDSHHSRDEEVHNRVLELYHNDPNGCYFRTRLKTVNWELLLSATVVREELVVGLLDWNYEDIYSLMPLVMDLPMVHIPLFTGFLKNVKERVGAWFPLCIGDRYVIFDVCSDNSEIRALVQDEVERFQISNGLECVTSKWGWWIGAT